MVIAAWDSVASDTSPVLPKSSPNSSRLISPFSIKSFASASVCARLEYEKFLHCDRSFIWFCHCASLLDYLWRLSLEIFPSPTVTLFSMDKRVYGRTVKMEAGFAPGPKDGQKLSKEDRKVLTLRNRGLWPSEIAALYHLEEEAPAIEIRAHVVKRNLLQDGVAEVARPFDTCRNSHLERVIGRGAGR